MVKRILTVVAHGDFMEQPHLKTSGEPATGYHDLKHVFAGLSTLFSIRGTLTLDMMTALPAGGLTRRLHDIAAITRRIHAEATSDSVARLLDQAENEAAANPENQDVWNVANLREMRRIHTRLTALPPDLYAASAQTAGEGRQRHADALNGQGWHEVKFYLSQTIDLYRRIAERRQKAFGARTPYDALLTLYADGLSETRVDAVYDSLLKPLAALRDAAIEKEKSLAPPLPLDGDFSRGDQMWLNKTILEIMGFDFSRGTLQITTLSPRTGGNADDARLLVRCGEGACFLDSLEDTLYQGARGLYLQNLPADWMTQPVGRDLGPLMMNALSNLYETILGRTPQFFDFVSTRAEGAFRQFRNKSFEPENLYRLKKIITPTARRDNADELTKIFHDAMRYRIERDLINGDLSVTDLPGRWNAESARCLGVMPQTAEEGPLQNPDWFTGRFGFIPANTLSHIMACALHEKLYAEMGHMNDMIRFGDLKPINQWLKKNIHEKGKSVETFALMEQITDEPFSIAPLLRHLERRYLSDKR